jgi:hypothetical protein
MAHLFLNLNLLGRVCQAWQPAADNDGYLVQLQIKKKSAPNGHYYLQRAVTPDQINHQNILQRAGGP